MNINNFEEYIDDIILERGYKYYTAHHVRDISNASSNTYIAVVEGTDDYEITVSLDANKNIIAHHCDCPYDFSDICKHKVAVLFKIRDILSCAKSNVVQFMKKEKIDKVEKSKHLTQKDHMLDIIKTWNKEQLLHFIERECLTEELIRKTLLRTTHGSLVDEQKNCNNYIKSTIKKYSEKGGFISYYNSTLLSEELYEIFEWIEDALEDGNYKRAVIYNLCILKSVIPVFEYADDSDGCIGGLITQAIENVTLISVDGLPEEIKYWCFKEVLKEAKADYFNGWDEWRFELLGCCVDFAVTNEHRKTLEKELTIFEEHYAKNHDELYNEHIYNTIDNIKYFIIEKFDGFDKKLEFLQKNIHITEFRERIIDILMDSKKYGNVEQVLLDGEKQDKNLPGLIKQWRKKDTIYIN